MFEFLVLSLPTRNSTLRMRVWRALKDAGCAVLRDGVYVVPLGRTDTGSLVRVSKDIRSYGGLAMRLETAPKEAADAKALRRLFDRTPEYTSLAEAIAKTKADLARLGPKRGQTAIGRIEQSLRKVVHIDFFPGEAKGQVTGALEDLKARYRELHSTTEPRASLKGLRHVDPARYQKRVWATRKSPWVDRLASGWLIKRFVDRDAKFVWLERPSELPKNAVGFDFDGAEFTHVKNRVTFEVLLSTFGLETDIGLAAIAKAVHFLDVGGIPAADAGALETMLKGVKETARTDDQVLAGAMRTLDLLYAGYRSATSTAT